jgi:hypothetical protein
MPVARAGKAGGKQLDRSTSWVPDRTSRRRASLGGCSAAILDRVGHRSRPGSTPPQR